MPRRLLISSILVVLTLPCLALAQTESSTHYEVQQPVISSGDNTDASSASYSQQGSIGEPASGPSESGSYSGQSGFDRTSTGSSGGSNNSNNETTVAGGNGPVAGCGDPVASNYDSSALGGSDAGCLYPSSSIAPPIIVVGVTTSPSVAPVSSISTYGTSGHTRAPSALPDESSNPTTPQGNPDTSLILTQTSVFADTSVTAQLSFPIHTAPLRVTFSIVRPDGSVSTSTTIVIEPSASMTTESLSTRGLPAGTYVLHAQVLFPNGISEDLNEPFSVDSWNNPFTYAVIFVIIVVLYGLFFLKRRERLTC